MKPIKHTEKMEIEQFDLLIAFKNMENTNIAEINPIESEKGLEEIETALNNTESFFYIKESEFIDVVTVDLDVNPVLGIEQFKKNQTVAIEKVVPIDIVVPTINEIIVKNVLRLAAAKIKNGESFTVKCELRDKRNVKSSDKLIYQISHEICRKLNHNYDEKNANWIILIEGLGATTGIGITKNQNMFLNQ